MAAPDPQFDYLTGPHELTQAVEAHIRKWIDTYLAEVERQNDIEPRHLSRPRAYIHKQRLEALPGEDQNPAIILVSRGNREAFRNNNGGEITIPYDLGIAAVVNAPEQYVRRNGGMYGIAIAGLMLHARRRSLDGALDGRVRVLDFNQFQLEDTQDEDSRTQAIVRLEFTVTVKNAIKLGAGPAQPDPPTDPEIPPGPWPTVDDVITTIEKGN